MLKIAVVEDEHKFRSQIVRYIEDYASENNIETDIKEFSDGLELTRRYKKIYDILLLDIELPFQNGMDAAIEVRKKDTDVVIVFITNMARYAIKGYEVDALDFILKPINYFAFSRSFSRAIKRIKKNEKKQISLTMQSKIISLNSDEIYYIESCNRFLNYFTATNSYSIRGTMKTIEQELEDYNFVRCNHWYLVNLEHVSSILSNHVILGDYKLEISRRNKATFREAFTNYIKSVK